MKTGHKSQSKDAKKKLTAKNPAKSRVVKKNVGERSARRLTTTGLKDDSVNKNPREFAKGDLEEETRSTAAPFNRTYGDRRE